MSVSSSLRLSASLLFSAAAALIALAGPVATTACSGGVCSADEEKKCNEAHGACTAGCGNGTKIDPATGLPSEDPNYSACVSSCNTKLCSCLDSCGSTCSK